MSASILHKEIEIDHGGVHYTVVIDAEKQHHDTIHSLDGLEASTESEHQDELGKVEVHYEEPDTEHLHHHVGEENHHGLDVHIDLDTGHVSAKEHHHEHQLPLHETEHHGLKQHHILVHHEVSHGLGQDHNDEESQTLKYLIQLGLGHHSSKYSDLGHTELSPYNSELHVLHHGDLEHILEHLGTGEQGLDHNEVDVPIHQVIGGGNHVHLRHYDHVPGAWIKHHVGQDNYVLGHQNGIVWHLHPSNTVKHVGVHSGGHGSEQGYIYGQPLNGLEGVHVIHHTDIHH